MGKVVEHKKRKKKGRPSLLDLQKRNLKLQQQQQKQQLKNSHQLQKTPKNTPTRIHRQNPNSASNTSGSVRRSTRRNPQPATDDDEGEAEVQKGSSAKGTDDEDEQAQQKQLSGKKRREKDLKSVLKLPNSTSADSGHSDSGPDSNAEDNNSGLTDRRKRKFDAIGGGSEGKVAKLEEKHAAVTNPEESRRDADDGPSTPLPDEKLLLFILDRLQKKDSYGVFSEPVDPEELPDYHEIISNPMDFGTVRKKLTDGKYANLEQFENDILLICSNAMQYNAPDTVYFRQARGIQEMALKDFENLRQDSEDEPETKVPRRGRPPMKNLKKAFARLQQERSSPGFSEATHASGGENSNRANHEHKKGNNAEKYGSTNSHGQPYSSLLAERYNRNDEMAGSASKGLSMKFGKRQIILDESKRGTYIQPHESPGRLEPSVFTVFDCGRKQLVSVGVHTEYGYTRSLARFASKLGPVAWKVASRKIQRCLPRGVEFGPGWVGENDIPIQRQLPQPLSTTSQTPPQLRASPHGSSSSAGKPPALESGGRRSLQRPGGHSSAEQPGPSSSVLRKVKLEAHPVEPSSGSITGPVTLSVSSSIAARSSSGPAPGGSGTVRGLQPQSAFNLSSSVGTNRPGPVFQNSLIQSRANGINGTYGFNATATARKMNASGKPSGVNLQSQPSLSVASTSENLLISTVKVEYNNATDGKVGNSNSRRSNGNCEPQQQNSLKRSAQKNQKADSAPPDLNVRFQSAGSPATSKGEGSQPDLALQL